MKLLHTTDWHLGRIFFGHHLTDDQAYLLDQVIDIATRNTIDVLIIAGDVYDRGVPPTEAIELLDQALRRLVKDKGIPVILIAGNHDSPERIDFGSSIFASSGLHMRGTATADVEPIRLKDKHGYVYIYPIPYCEPSRVRLLSEDESIRTHSDAMQYWMNYIKQIHPKGSRSVVVAHAFAVGGISTEESERPLSTGGVETVDIRNFDGIDYIALGHLHSPQHILAENIHYAGSLMPYSFSEATQRQSISLVELGPDGLEKVERIALEPRRQVRIIKGELEELLRGEGSDDYISAELTDTKALLNPLARLRDVYPHILQMKQSHFLRLAEDGNRINTEDLAKRTDLELYEEFFNYATDRELSADAKEWLASVIEDLRREEIDA